ncbi:hypothetical protein BpHYR1_033117 [Brachionus plicatilis]|uniref:Uncharacterized protein n=1 Tax=Brachionus plicatilis TaxID=10195 RepID=A0A3M7PNF3_BRAPC|nr:hypothetical protein BpHYR1_033117 [Brachionus plicatilis]
MKEKNRITNFLLLGETPSIKGVIGSNSVEYAEADFKITKQQSNKDLVRDLLNVFLVLNIFATVGCFSQVAFFSRTANREKLRTQSLIDSEIRSLVIAISAEKEFLEDF